MNANFYFESPLLLSKNGYKDNIRAFFDKRLRIKHPIYFNSKETKRSKQSHYYLKLSRDIKGITTSVFQLHSNGIPIWGIAVNISYDSSNFGIYSVTYDKKLLRSSELKKTEKGRSNTKISIGVINKALDIDRNILRLKAMKVNLEEFKHKIQINKVTEIYYNYSDEQRQHTSLKTNKKDKVERLGIFNSLPILRLPKVDKKITENKIYRCREVLFTSVMPWGKLNWRLIIDNETDSALYIRVLTENLGGLIYKDAPSAITGNNSLLPTSPMLDLNEVRGVASIPGLSSNIPPYSLSGEYVEINELTLPTNSVISSSTNFDYNVNTEEFAAVNAYVHNDALFRLVADMGFDMSVYFDGTTFPVPVDHNGSFGCVNACAPGNPAGDGSGGFHYGVMQSGTSVGISLSKRVALHEFGHAILWDNVHDPNLGFCHSVGDSLAAILLDPHSIAPDRFVTFPWLTLANPTIDRRHDRSVSSGWGWYGTNDDGAYGSEQIMSSSIFRLYQSIGGDSEDICRREWAARYTAYLIFLSVGSLTPITNSPNPDHWTQIMMQSDFITTEFESHIGRTVHKVNRWAFERQNAFNGLPPAVDLYIKDKRAGSYEYVEEGYHSKEIWNRLAPDGGNVHQEPILGQINYAYVVVRNRGVARSRALIVKGYQSNSNCCKAKSKALCWPSDFDKIKTHEIRARNISPGGYDVIGPFEWEPCHVNSSILFEVSCRRDQSNISILRNGDKVSIDKLALFDNNIALRKMCTDKCCS